MKYRGGKNATGTFHQIINQIPPHDLYIEPFVGSGAILRLKRPAPSSIAIDADGRAVENLRSTLAQNGDAFRNVHLIHNDAMHILLLNQHSDAYNDPRTFIYLDPPYLFETRSRSRRYYAHEFGEPEQHRRLLHLLKSLHCSIALSGYDSGLYADELADWRKISFMVISRGRKMVRECLWMNYPEPVALHDYRYLGKDFREREAIKRQKNNWVRRLQKMPTLRRYVLMQALEETRP